MKALSAAQERVLGRLRAGASYCSRGDRPTLRALVRLGLVKGHDDTSRPVLRPTEWSLTPAGKRHVLGHGLLHQDEGASWDEPRRRRLEHAAKAVGLLYREHAPDGEHGWWSAFAEKTRGDADIVAHSQNRREVRLAIEAVLVNRKQRKRFPRVVEKLERSR